MCVCSVCESTERCGEIDACTAISAQFADKVLQPIKKRLSRNSSKLIDSPLAVFMPTTITADSFELSSLTPITQINRSQLLSCLGLLL